MTEHLDLDAIAEDSKPSMTFTLAGKKFRCKQPNDLPWDLMERWIIAQAENNTREIITSVDEFFCAVLFEKDVDAFMELKRRKPSPLTQKRALALIQGINAQLLSGGGVDPTKQQSASRSGSETTVSSSTAKRSRRGTRGASAA